jgi:iron complex outermembrane receptor protein
VQTRSSIDLLVNEQWTSDLRAVWGGELWRETVESPQNYQTTKTLSGELARVHGNLEWRAHPRLLLQAGALLEHHYFTGADVSPRLAANFTLTPGHVIRLGVSRAYRSPTFFEEEGNLVLLKASGAAADIVTIPSAGLDAERILSREIAYLGHWRPPRLDLDVRLYRDQIDQFIGQVKTSAIPDVAGSPRPKVFTFDNIGGIESQGGEIQLRWRPVPALDVSAYFARGFLSTDTADGNFSEDIPLSLPRNSWGMLASYRLASGWEASLFAQRSDTQKWLTEGDTTQAFTRVDLRLARRWNWQGRAVEAALVGQNLGDDYQEFRDTNIFSRRVYGSLGFAW